LRLLTVTLLLCMLVATVSCGNGNNSTSAASSISGNWQLTLTRHNSTQQWTFSGFLLQSGGTVTGSFILGAGECQGVGPVSGSFDGQNLQLTVGTFGQDFSLSASLPSGSAAESSIDGQFSTLAGGCIGFASTGTWTAVRVPSLSGPFHGSFIVTDGTNIDVTGTLTQGPNIGASNVTLSGTMNATGGPSFCSYLSTATVTGLISGTSAILSFYGPDGSQVGQIPSPGFGPATVAADGTSLTGSYAFSAISSSCSGLTGGQGDVTLTFP